MHIKYLHLTFCGYFWTVVRSLGHLQLQYWLIVYTIFIVEMEDRNLRRIFPLSINKEKVSKEVIKHSGN